MMETIISTVGAIVGMIAFQLLAESCWWRGALPGTETGAYRHRKPGRRNATGFIEVCMA